MTSKIHQTNLRPKRLCQELLRVHEESATVSRRIRDKMENLRLNWSIKRLLRLKFPNNFSWWKAIWITFSTTKSFRGPKTSQNSTHLWPDSSQPRSLKSLQMKRKGDQAGRNRQILPKTLKITRKLQSHHSVESTRQQIRRRLAAVVPSPTQASPLTISYSMAQQFLKAMSPFFLARRKKIRSLRRNRTRSRCEDAPSTMTVICSPLLTSIVWRRGSRSSMLIRGWWWHTAAVSRIKWARDSFQRQLQKL